MKVEEFKLVVPNASDDPIVSAIVSIYENSFPSSERKPNDTFLSLFRNTNYRIWIARELDRILGFGLVFSSPIMSFSLLEYLAVNSEWRGIGIGRVILESIMNSGLFLTRFLLIEVESETIEGQKAYNIAKRRRKFYYRFGFREIIGLRYIMPNINNAIPPPMNLMIKTPHSAKSVDKAVLEDWVRAIYEEVYNAAVEDRILKEMMKQCTGFIDP